MIITKYGKKENSIFDIATSKTEIGDDNFIYFKIPEIWRLYDDYRTVSYYDRSVGWGVDKAKKKFIQTANKYYDNNKKFFPNLKKEQITIDDYDYLSEIVSELFDNDFDFLHEHKTHGKRGGIGMPLFGPLKLNGWDKEGGAGFRLFTQGDTEEVWTIIGHIGDEKVSAGIYKKDFYYSNGAWRKYHDQKLHLWQNYFEGHIKSSERGWIGWALVPRSDNKTLQYIASWNMHSFKASKTDLHRKIYQYLMPHKRTGRFLKSLILTDRNWADEEWERFEREQQVDKAKDPLESLELF